jgi:ferredoxin
MSNSEHSSLTEFLYGHDQQSWLDAIDTLSPSIHEVDRDATRIWFSFWPLWLANALRGADSIEKLARELDLKGEYRLADQIDSSHAFLYGHRFWPQVKAALVARDSRGVEGEEVELSQLAEQVAADAAGSAGGDKSLLLGISAVALMTLRQVGSEAFAASPGKVQLSASVARRTPSQIIAARAKNDGAGLAALFKGIRREYTITFDEKVRSAKFKLIGGLEMTTASMIDPRDHSGYIDSRCRPGDGPIPTECRSGACGTCWVGVLGGSERLSDVAPLEARRMKRFGYIDSDEPRPVIRLACKAKASGNVTVVVPPWSGVFGNYLQDKEAGIGGSAAAGDEKHISDPRRH